MTITLPLPHPRLSPNARCHWRVKALATKKARKAAYLTTRATPNQGVEFTRYRLAFYWPDKRKRDDDNAAASCKAYRDGIADALKIDDHTLRMDSSPAMLLDRKRPRLEFHLLP